MRYEPVLIRYTPVLTRQFQQLLLVHIRVHVQPVQFVVEHPGICMLTISISSLWIFTGVVWALRKSITISFVLLESMWRCLKSHQSTKSVMTTLYSIHQRTSGDDSCQCLKSDVYSQLPILWSVGECFISNSLIHQDNYRTAASMNLLGAVFNWTRRPQKTFKRVPTTICINGKLITSIAVQCSFVSRRLALCLCALTVNTEHLMTCLTCIN